MGLFKRSASHAAETACPALALGPPIALAVIEDTHAYEGDDGESYWSIGLAPVHEDTDGEYHFLRPGDSLSDSRAIYCKVAGVKHYPKALKDSRFKPPCPAILIPEPNNAHDANAVGVWDSSGSVQAGHIPRELSAEIAARMRAGEQLMAMMLREIRRGSRSGPRAALHLLVVPPCELQMKMVKEDD